MRSLRILLLVLLSQLLIFTWAHAQTASHETPPQVIRSLSGRVFPAENAFVGNSTGSLVGTSLAIGDANPSTPS